jgi:hypothetical protein
LRAEVQDDDGPRRLGLARAQDQLRL